MGHKNGTASARTLIVYNPRSGKGNVDISPALGVLREEGWDVTVREMRHNGDGTKCARKAVKQGFDVVVASGGDGTVNEVMSGLVGSEVPLGVLPIGTMNLWAGQLGYADRLDVVARQLVLGEQRNVDVGQVAVDGSHVGYFLIVAGLGADAVILDRTSRKLKNRIGSLAVAVAAAEALPALDVVPIRALIDGVSWHGRSGQIVIGNSRRYGGFTRVTGRAYIDDGLLDLCIFTVDNLLGAARQAASLLLRQKPAPSSAEVYRASSIRIQALRPLALEIDGSAVDQGVTQRDAKKGHKPTEYAFTVLPAALRALVPRTYSGELFQPTPLTTSFALGAVVPVTSDGHAADKASGHVSDQASDHAHSNGHDHRHQGNVGPTRHRMRVLAVGVDTVLAQQLPEGRMIALRVGKHTHIEDGQGGARHTLSQGDIVEVKGKLDAHTGTLKARRIALLDVPASPR